MRMLLSADEAANYAVRAKDAADTTMNMMSDITVAVCQLKDPASLLPTGSTSGSVEVNFDGFQDTIVSGRAGDDAVESVVVVQRDDEDDDVSPARRSSKRGTAENKQKKFRKVLRGRRRDRDSF
mmetsp:Transcript_31083/g.51344  ORF Transcript_31083/g.51344 Transcript_31083/m.51344 type:complete len:124 (-) Transcript_31083:341-712(-)|eukprot:CAMPEP_0119009026 /NCGR_PEP_ID=MMETSP1176-20130426/4092_1 /TAXON_ID=265551 /ORGANISM="Synedropsis recta cf, Strain CCMP1620" /LENGTH=123 /DNA_ID=CAMNT_0006961457 /DNA_START=112 /DNA_END=483 /DNA_ORIENTATION=-